MVYYLEPPTLDTAIRRRDESTQEWLARSTMPFAIELRAFLNEQLARLPPEVASQMFLALQRRDFLPTIFELVVLRVAMQLGADSVSYEAPLGSGKRPDLTGGFPDGAVVIDAFRAMEHELVREMARDEDLIAIIEDEIPKGWRFSVHHLPGIGPQDSKQGFRALVRRLLADLPTPTPGTSLIRAGDHPLGRLELRLDGGWPHDRAWASGPGYGSFGDTEKRLRKALAHKRAQMKDAGPPVLLAYGAEFGATTEDVEWALFGRHAGRSTFIRSGLWGRSTSTATPAIAGVLAFCGFELTRGNDPVLFIHPRFVGALPRGLQQLETRVLEPAGVRVTPATFEGVFEAIRRPSAAETASSRDRRAGRDITP